MIAAGAEDILRTRQNGHRPSEAVVVSLVGELPVQWLVQPDLDTEYDWLPLVDLDIWVICHYKHLVRVGRMLWQMKRHRPRNIWVLVEDRDRAFELVWTLKLESIKKPIDQWEWELERQPLLKIQKQAMKLVLGEQA